MSQRVLILIDTGYFALAITLSRFAQIFQFSEDANVGSVDNH
jgi:hypothetical protein